MDMGGDNSLLAMLPAGPRSALQPHLTRVSLVQRQILWNAHQPITDVLFPVTALVSIVGQAGKGEDVEIAAVGRFGMVGVPVFLGDGQASQAAVVQLPGEAERISAAAFREVAAHQPELRRLLMRFVQAFVTETGQSAVCNCHHHAERRAPIPFHRGLVERACERVLEQLEQIRLEAQQDRLRFGIPEAAVELERARVARLVDHQPGVEKSAERHAVLHGARDRTLCEHCGRDEHQRQSVRSSGEYTLTQKRPPCVVCAGIANGTSGPESGGNP